MDKLKKILEISIFKTLRFNLHYFGLRGLRLPVLVSRNFILRRLGGTVSVPRYQIGLVKMGFSGVGIFDHRRSKGIWEVSGRVDFGGKAQIGHGSKVSVADGGHLVVGDDYVNSAESEIVCHDSIKFGSGARISWDTLIMDTDFHSIDGAPITAPIVFEDHVWVCCRSVVLKGSHIPTGSVIAAGSTVSKRLPVEAGLYGGANKLLKEGVTWNFF